MTDENSRQTTSPYGSPCGPKAHNSAIRLGRVAKLLWVPTALLVALAVLIAAGSRSASAAELRLMGASGKFVGRYQVALTTSARAPDVLSIDRLEIAAGVLAGNDEQRPFVSAGPVWALRGNDRRFVELGIAPTVLAGSSFDGRDLGGNFHFTSSVAIGLRFGVRRSGRIALRVQHLSNAGLAGVNPGMDMVGLQLDLPFDR